MYQRERDTFSRLVEAAYRMIEAESSACHRSEAAGETGMRARFTELRKATREADRALQRESVA